MKCFTLTRRGLSDGMLMALGWNIYNSSETHPAGRLFVPGTRILVSPALLVSPSATMLPGAGSETADNAPEIKATAVLVKASVATEPGEFVHLVSPSLTPTDTEAALLKVVGNANVVGKELLCFPVESADFQLVRLVPHAVVTVRWRASYVTPHFLKGGAPVVASSRVRWDGHNLRLSA